MYRFFAALTGLCGEVEELSPGTDLPASPDGQVNWIPGSRTLPEFLAGRCGEPVPEPMGVRDFLRNAGIAAPESAPDYKVLRNGRADSKIISIFGLRSEPGILAFLHWYDGREWNILPEEEKATLIVAARDGEEELLAAPRPGDGSRLFSLDVRGFGKSFPLTSDRGQ